MHQAQSLFTLPLVPTMIQMLDERGIAFEDVLREAELPATSGRDEITAPQPKIERLLQVVAHRLGAAQLGLDLADRVPHGAHGLSEFVVETAPSVHQALHAMRELAPLVDPLLHIRYSADHRGLEVHFVYASNRDGLGQILNEYFVAHFVRNLGAALGCALPVERVWFAHGRDSGHDDVARRFGCNARFQAGDCGFAVRGDLMQVPTPSGREAIHAFLLAQAREQIASQGKGATIMQVVRVIEARISDPDLSPLTVARSLSLSQRTLQRQLADAGTTFRDLLASVRRRRRDELARKGLGAAEIAPHLGFASAKTMRRSLNDNRGSVEANEPRQNAA